MNSTRRPFVPLSFPFLYGYIWANAYFGERYKVVSGYQTGSSVAMFSHLFFADNAMIFFKASHESCANVYSILVRLCTILVQQLNLKKTLSHSTQIHQSRTRTLIKQQCECNKWIILRYTCQLMLWEKSLDIFTSLLTRLQIYSLLGM